MVAVLVLAGLPVAVVGLVEKYQFDLPNTWESGCEGQFLSRKSLYNIVYITLPINEYAISDI